MHFEPNTIYHIYNQGNNRQRIFFEVKNYLFFLQKMRTHLLPYGDLLCYCLMPNHFHWLLFVREVEVGVSAASASAGATQSRPGTFDAPRLRSLNDSIGILLSSYTRAINKQETRTGALFREETKAKWLGRPLFVACTSQISTIAARMGLVWHHLLPLHP